MSLRPAVVVFALLLSSPAAAQGVSPVAAPRVDVGQEVWVTRLDREVLLGTLIEVTAQTIEIQVGDEVVRLPLNRVRRVQIAGGRLTVKGALVGTGIGQLVGGLLTAVVGLSILFYINWHLTVAIILILSAFGGVMAFAFARLRPLFRERGEINAQVTEAVQFFDGKLYGGTQVVYEARHVEVFHRYLDTKLDKLYREGEPRNRSLFAFFGTGDPARLGHKLDVVMVPKLKMLSAA